MISSNTNKSVYLAVASLSNLQENNKSFYLDLFKHLKLGDCVECKEQKETIINDINNQVFTMEDFYKIGRKNYKSCMCKSNLVFINDIETKYLIIYPNDVEVCVSKSTFNKIQGKVKLQNGYVVKYFGNKPLIKNRKFKREKVEFQGITEVFNRTKNIIKEMSTTCVGVKDTISSAYGSLLSVVDSIKKTCSKLPELKRYVVMIRDIFTPLVSIFGLISSISLINLTAIIGNVISMFKVVDEFDKEGKNKAYIDVYQYLEDMGRTVEQEEDEYDDSLQYNMNLGGDVNLQSLEGLCGAAAVQLLPKWIQKTLSTFTSLSSTKLLDDNLMLAKFFRTLNLIIFTILGALVNRGIMSSESYNKIEEFFDGTCLGKYTYYVLCMEKAVKQVVLDGQIVNDIKYQDSNLKLYKEMCEDKINTGTYVERNGAVKTILEQFTAIIKLIKSNRDITRIEPICIILEGKPKTGKSQTMSRLTECFLKSGVSVYSHTTPNPKISKDFYDDYSNQEIFIMDDVGQQGNSQWCQIINLVSPIKYGLPCANAALKQTKYMSSKVLMGTTNELETLVFSKDDGVNEPDALFRRCDIINFDYVVMVPNERGFLKPSGRLIYKHYELGNDNVGGSYVQGFDPNFALFAPELDPVFTYEGRTDEDQLRWLLQIVNKRIQYKKAEKKSCELNFDKILDGLDFQFLGFDTGKIDVIASLRKYFVVNTLDVVVSSCSLMVSSLFASIANKTVDIVNVFKDNLLTIIMIIVGFGVSYELLSFFTGSTDEKLEIKSKVVLESLLEDVIKKYDFKSSLTTSDECIRKNVRFIKFIVELPNGDRFENIGCCTISGSSILTNYHFMLPGLIKYDLADFENKIYAIVYSDLDKNMVMYDHIQLKPSLVLPDEDVIVWSLPLSIPSLLPDISHLFGKELANDIQYKLITPSGFVDLSSQIVNSKYSFTIPTHKKNKLLLCDKNSICYEFSVAGACGSVVTNDKGKIVGFHVAGNVENGFSRIWSKEVIGKIVGVMQQNNGIRYKLDVLDGEDKFENCSIVKCKNAENWSVSVPKKSKLVTSGVAGVFPFTRLPVNMEQDNVIKDMAKKSYKHVQNVDTEALDFAKKYIKHIIPKYSKVSEREVVLGTEKGNKINKKSSGGFGFDGGKDKYLDYDNGVYKEDFNKIILDLKRQVKDGAVDISNIVYKETLKDELRDVRKVDKPRCFKMSPLSLTCLGRELFLELIDKLHDARWENGIMIGVNPFEEWHKIMNISRKFSNNCGDGDYGEWDGSMLTQFQTMVSDVLIGNFCGSEEDRKLVRFFLMSLINCVTLNMNELLVTTHSMPSGCMLTAVFNCLINKAYGAYIYYKIAKRNNVKPTLEHFLLNFYSCVYGDDILLFFSDELLKYMDCLTYADECRLLGLTFTTADKVSNMVRVKGIEDCQFLKRNFKYDVDLGYVCPLDIVTMEGTLNFVSQANRKEELTQVKIWNFQREAFLHGKFYYNKSTQVIKEYVAKNDLHYNFLNEDYLRDLYATDKDAYGEGLFWYNLYV